MHLLPEILVKTPIFVAHFFNVYCIYIERERQRERGGEIERTRENREFWYTYMSESRLGLFAWQWRHNDHDGLSNHQPHDCLINRLFRRRSKKTSKLRVTGLYVGNSPVTGELPPQRASNAENVYIWWRHHAPSTCVMLNETNLTSTTV